MIDAIIVGCGRMAGSGDVPRPDAYAPAILRSSKYLLVAGVDHLEAKAQAFADHYGCEAFGDLEAALEAFHPQVVIVATPDDQHASVLKLVMESRFCPEVAIVEKPYCLCESEAQDISAAQDKSRVSVFVNHSRRLDVRYHQLRSAIREGRLGDPLKLRATYYGGWLHNGIHVVDTLNFLFDSTPIWTSATRIPMTEVPADPTLSLVGVLRSSGALVEVEGIDAKHYQMFEFELRFTEARVLIENFGDSIAIQYARMNEQNERVLGSRQLLTSVEQTSSTDVLLTLVDQHLEGVTSTQLSEVSLSVASSSMRALWDGVELARIV